jgi:diguanylate cyclase (GGDEF)-like protein/PAS domain S-box-containing protein
VQYPVVADEELRLAALRSLDIIGTPRTPSFDAITRLAAATFGCPISFISLLDSDQQWFKAECGLGAASTPRDIAFCNYTVLGNEPFIVEDARRDARFAKNPLVTRAPRIRFYAGVPIAIDSGHKIGALCLSDTKPRVFTPSDIERLKEFGRVVEGLVEAHSQSVRAASAARDAAEKAHLLWKRNRLLRQVERIGKIGGWELDLSTQIVEWSDEVSRIHELAMGDSCPLEEALAFYPDDWRAVVRRNIANTIQTGEPYDFEAEFVTASGRKKWVRAAGECEYQDKTPARLFGMFQDITIEKAATERLRFAANFDELTSVANRRHFNQALTAAIEQAARTGCGVTLIILDLDNFKRINDTRGHAVGDQILAEVANRLSHAVPEGLVARLGGDEFAVVIAGDLPADRIEKCGRQILACLKKPIRVGPTSIAASGSLGVARFPADAPDAGDLLTRADLALYSAKQNARGTVRLYSSDLAEVFEHYDRAVDLAASALATKRLVPYYQPKVRMAGGKRHSFEALARIVTPDKTVLAPDQFAPALQDREMGRRIGRRMLRAVTADLAAWRNAGLEPGSVSLNVGEIDFADGKLATRILKRLDQLALPHSSLTVEVTELVFLGDEAGHVREALARLDAEGVIIELDDFGTGYASLMHLREFPIRRLKIDRSFVRDLGADAGSRAIVRAVIGLGHNLDCEIIAEGVETGLQADLLKEMGCDSAQGYLFGYPASARETRAMLVEEAATQTQLLRTIAARHAAERPEPLSVKTSARRQS